MGSVACPMPSTLPGPARRIHTETGRKSRPAILRGVRPRHPNLENATTDLQLRPRPIEAPGEGPNVRNPGRETGGPDHDPLDPLRESILQYAERGRNPGSRRTFASFGSRRTASSSSETGRDDSSRREPRPLRIFPSSAHASAKSGRERRSRPHRPAGEEPGPPPEGKTARGRSVRSCALVRDCSIMTP